MNPLLILFLFFCYFLIIFLISHFTSKNATSLDFFNANKSSPWYIVAFGMIGTSLSGVTFISVPGEVGNSNFSYFQIVIGYLLGYFVIATILMPLYYKLNLVSIYTYLDKRFGFCSYKTGSFFFLLSRIIGSSFRLFLVASVLQIIFFDSLNIPFFISVFITISLIWVYTYKGGIKTIVWTDTLQTAAILVAAGATLYYLSDIHGDGFSGLWEIASNSDLYSFKGGKVTEGNIWLGIFNGIIFTIAMAGLDQDIMQKNLTCKNKKDAQKNLTWFSIVLVPINFIFLILGILIFETYMGSGDLSVVVNESQVTYSLNVQGNMTELAPDQIYPSLAKNGYFPLWLSGTFLIGLIAAAYSSADSALTSLTTSFCIDFLDIQKRNNKRKTRLLVHIGFSILLFIVILIFNEINDESVINSIFKAAGYTYGPLLGLFSFGIFTKYKIKDKFVFFVCLISPLISYLINIYSEELLFGYRFGFEILLLNGLLTFLGLYFIKR